MDETSVIDEEIVNDMFFAHQVSVHVIIDVGSFSSYCRDVKPSLVICSDVMKCIAALL